MSLESLSDIFGDHNDVATWLIAAKLKTGMEQLKT